MRPTSASISIIHVLSEERPTLRHLASVRWGLLVAALAAGGDRPRHRAQRLEPRCRSTTCRARRPGSASALVLLLIAFWSTTAAAVALAARSTWWRWRRWWWSSPIGSRRGRRAQLVPPRHLRRLQPSEFAKLATALLLARYLADVGPRYLSAAADRRSPRRSSALPDGAGRVRARLGRRRDVRADARRHAAGGRHPAARRW